MRTTVDIPDELYRAIKVMAAERGGTVRELILEGLEMVLRTRETAGRRLELPVIRSTQPRSSEINNETIDDVIGFP
jgi:metal-responsive CopG/Arc/MetJ family transcriptional regulator